MTMDQMTDVCNMKGCVCSDKLAENNFCTLPFPSAVQSLFSIFKLDVLVLWPTTLLFWFA